MSFGYAQNEPRRVFDPQIAWPAPLKIRCHRNSSFASLAIHPYRSPRPTLLACSSTSWVKGEVSRKGCALGHSASDSPSILSNRSTD